MPSNPPAIAAAVLPVIPLEKLLFHGDGQQRVLRLPPAPPWRSLEKLPRETRGKGFQATAREKLAVNLALYLRRPLLVTGQPGTGKSSLAYAIAHEFQIDPVLVWPITSRTTLQQGEYTYDAIGRLQARSLDPNVPPPPITRFLRLGPLGTALACSTEQTPAVLLIDEFDKSDIDLPNDLLHLFEEGGFEIPELARLAETGGEHATLSVRCHGDDRTVVITGGRVRCRSFPIIVITSNDEREFPPAFQRRCLRLDIRRPDEPGQLRAILRERVPAAMADEHGAAVTELINDFLERAKVEPLATDQLLNAAHLLASGVTTPTPAALREFVLRPLGER